MRAMRKQYGEKEGEKVFYASKNKGTISGVEKTEESKMSYLEKVLSISEEEKRGVKPGSMLADMGFTGAKKTDLSKLPKGKKTLKNPDQNIAPMGKKNESHTEYKRMGLMMAEALGYRVDEIAPVLGMAAKAIGKKVVGGVAKKAAKKGAEMATDKMKPEQQEESWTVYKQIGKVLSEVYSPKKHAEVSGGGEEAAKRRADRMGKVMRGKGVSPMAAVGGLDTPKPLSKGKEEMAAKRKKTRELGLDRPV